MFVNRIESFLTSWTGPQPLKYFRYGGIVCAVLLSGSPIMAQQTLIFQDLDTVILDGADAGVDSYSPAVAVNGLDEAAVVWSDDESGPIDTLTCIFSRGLESLTDVVYVNDLYQDTNTKDPRVAAGKNNAFFFVWADNRSLEGLYDVYFSGINDQAINLFNKNILVNKTYENTNVEIPDITSLGNGIVAICWMDDRHQLKDIYARRFKEDGTPVDSRDFIVNPAYVDTNVSHPRVAGDLQGNAVIVWSDDRLVIPGQTTDYRNDIFARVLPRSAVSNAQGGWPGPQHEIMVSNSDNGSDDAVDPDIDGNNHGLYLVAWVNRTANKNDSHIYAAAITASGERLTDEFQVDLAPSPAVVADPAVTFLGYDIFLITWYDGREGGIFAGQMYDAASGLYIGPEFIVTDLVAQGDRPAGAMFSDRAFTTVWANGETGDRDVLGTAHIWDLLGDLTLDVRVNSNDLYRFALKWGPHVPKETAADFNVDGYVNGADIRVLREVFRSNLADRQPMTFSSALLSKTVGQVSGGKRLQIIDEKPARILDCKPRRSAARQATAELSKSAMEEFSESNVLETAQIVRSPQPALTRGMETKPLPRQSSTGLHQPRISEPKGLFFFNGKWR